MNLGEFRKRTAHLPDDTDILTEGDVALYYHEGTIDHILYPVLELPYAILMGGGQPINLDLDIDNRIDAALIFGDAEDT